MIPGKSFVTFSPHLPDVLQAAVDNYPAVPPANDWIAADDRLPTLEDSDCCGNLWACLSGHVFLAYGFPWTPPFAPSHAYWQRTKLEKPEPPKS